MRRVLVTGANKGIGLAIVEGILREQSDTFALLGARDGARGKAALDTLTAGHPAWKDRALVVEIDVGREDSVTAAAATVVKRFGEHAPVYGIVNNAGVGSNALGMCDVFDVNTRGVRRVCDAFLPLLDPTAGRIVNVTSGAAPMFVQQCSAERQRFFTDPKTNWRALETLMDECIALAEAQADFASKGLGDGNAYGLSKACTNTYTQWLASCHPNLRINACSPGFIETDMTRHYATSQGKTPADLGMKQPADGARCPLFLLFGEPRGNGWYYGSDAERSPMHRYRSPGTAPYAGD